MFLQKDCLTLKMGFLNFFYYCLCRFIKKEHYFIRYLKKSDLKFCWWKYFWNRFKITFHIYHFKDISLTLMKVLFQKIYQTLECFLHHWLWGHFSYKLNGHICLIYCFDIEFILLKVRFFIKTYVNFNNICLNKLKNCIDFDIDFRKVNFDGDFYCIN